MRTWARRVFNASLWIATALLAGFLIAFAARSLLALQDQSQPLSPAQYVDRRAADQAEVGLAAAGLEKTELNHRRKVAMAELELAWTAVQREEAALNEWASRQNLGAQGRRHPEFVKRDKSINGLRAKETAARAALEAIDAKLLATDQAIVRHRRSLQTESELGQQRFAAAQHQRRLGLLAEQITLGLLGVLAVCLAAAGTLGWRMARQNDTLWRAEQLRLQAEREAEQAQAALAQAERQRLEDEAAAQPQWLLPLDVELDPEVNLSPPPEPAPAPPAGRRLPAWLRRLLNGQGWRRGAAPQG